MSRKVRFFGVCLLATVITFWTGCAHKPAYNDLDANSSAVKQNQNQANASQVASPASPSQSTATDPASPAPASPASAAPTVQAAKRPSFFDEATGGIKDMPSYPRSTRVNVQVGPVEGFNAMSLGLRTRESMDKITAFYEQVIKSNKWTVVDKLIDPELSEWNLKKSEENSAKVQVKKDVATSMMNIVIVRAEKLEDPTKSAK